MKSQADKLRDDAIRDFKATLTAFLKKATPCTPDADFAVLPAFLAFEEDIIGIGDALGDALDKCPRRRARRYALRKAIVK